MAKGKLSSRQKMINLMYLVFIAMLAMQIDQEIIRSYQDTNQSLTDSRTSAQDKNKIFKQTLIEKAKILLKPLVQHNLNIQEWNLKLMS